MRAHPVELLPQHGKSAAHLPRLDRRNVVRAKGGDAPRPLRVGKQVLPPALHADENAQGNDVLAECAAAAAVDDLQCHKALRPHGAEQRIQDLAVGRAGDIVMLEGKQVGMRRGFVQEV